MKILNLRLTLKKKKEIKEINEFEANTIEIKKIEGACKVLVSNREEVINDNKNNNSTAAAAAAAAEGLKNII